MESKLYCSEPEYRRIITELAATAFHLSLEVPSDEADQEEHVEFGQKFKYIENHISKHAEVLSVQYNIPLEIVQNDIQECIVFLPKDDLTESYKLRKENKLN